jgi:broad specificity phosphatase PhoE
MLVHLVRHASHALLGRVLCGRSTDIGLDAAGRRQAEVLAQHFAAGGGRIALLQCSPRRRARETAGPIAQRLGLTLQIMPGIDEHDAGEWSGRAFEDLAQDPRWQAWNSERATNAPPGGESMGDLQRRIVQHLQTLAAESPQGDAIVISHAEPIRAALMHYGGISLGEFQRVPIEPAGIAILDINATHVRVSSPQLAAA